MKASRIIGIGAFICGTAVLLGAFGAHGLKDLVTPERITSWNTGVRYQMYHGFAIILIGLMMKNEILKPSKLIYRLFLTGLVLFSLSIYLLATRSIFGTEHWNFLGSITPIGGLLMIIAWFLLAYQLIFKSE